MRYLFGTGGNIINEFENSQETSEILTIEKIVTYFMKEHFPSLKDELQENDNSFISPEKSSLNLVMAYLLTNNKFEESDPVNEEEKEAAEKRNRLINENENEFQEIINLLKNMTR